jgi:CRP-like cAMP-binding protein
MRLLNHTHKTSLYDLPAFAGWSRREVERFRRLAEFVEYEPGESLTYQGSRAKEFLVLLDGLADIAVDGIRTGGFQPGDITGQDVMLNGGVATSTVRARHLCHAWVLSPTDFFALHAQQATLRELVGTTIATTVGVSTSRAVSTSPATLAY